MKRLLGLILVFGLFSSPSLGQSISDAFQSKNQVRAGLYLKILFTGGLKAQKTKTLSYGFQMGYMRDFKVGVGFNEPRALFEADLIRAEFKSFGFNKFNFAGQDILHYEPNELGFLTKKNGNIHWGKMGLFVLGAAVASYGIIKILDKGEEPDIN